VHAHTVHAHTSGAQHAQVDQANTSMNRPGGINNKGVFTRWRKPKLAAAAVEAAFKGAPSEL
jgi:hypothetical protein